MALTDGRAVVPTPGTKVPLSVAPVEARRITVAPLSTNTGVVVVGGVGVVAAAATRKGAALAPTTPPITLDVDDIDDVFLDAMVAGEGVSWLANDIVH